MPYDSVIDEAARANGLDPVMMRRISQIESGGDPTNQTGSYKGLFQLSDSEFGKHGGGDIYDPVANSNAAARKLAAESAAFKSKYGRDPSATDIYLTHQQGEGGYGAHMANPDAPAWENMVGTGEGRQKGDRWAKQAIWGNIPDDVKRLFPGGVETVTSKAFRDIWDRKVNGDASPMASAFAAEGTRNMNPIEAALAQARTKLQGFTPQPGEDPGILSSLAQQYAPAAAPYVPSADTFDKASMAFSMLRDNPAATAAGVAAYNAKNKDSDVQTIAHGDNLIQINRRTGKVLGMTPLPKIAKPPTHIKVDDGKGGQTDMLFDGTQAYPLPGAPTESSKFTPGEKKDDETFAKEHAPWVSGGAEGTKTSIDKLRGIAKELRDSEKKSSIFATKGNGADTIGDVLGPTGAAANLVPDALNAFINPKAKELKNRAWDAFQMGARGVLGSAYTEKEGRAFFESNYDASLSPSTNATNLERKATAMEKAATAKQSAAEYFQKNKSLRGFNYAAPSFDTFNEDTTPATAAPTSGGYKVIKVH